MHILVVNNNEGSNANLYLELQQSVYTCNYLFVLVN